MCIQRESGKKGFVCYIEKKMVKRHSIEAALYICTYIFEQVMLRDICINYFHFYFKQVDAKVGVYIYFRLELNPQNYYCIYWGTGRDKVARITDFLRR